MIVFFLFKPFIYFFLSFEDLTKSRNTIKKAASFFEFLPEKTDLIDSTNFKSKIVKESNDMPEPTSKKFITVEQDFLDIDLDNLKYEELKTFAKENIKKIALVQKENQEISEKFKKINEERKNNKEMLPFLKIHQKAINQLNDIITENHKEIEFLKKNKKANEINKLENKVPDDQSISSLNESAILFPKQLNILNTTNFYDLENLIIELSHGTDPQNQSYGNNLINAAKYDCSWFNLKISNLTSSSILIRNFQISSSQSKFIYQFFFPEEFNRPCNFLKFGKIMFARNLFKGYHSIPDFYKEIPRREQFQNMHNINLFVNFVLISFF